MEPTELTLVHAIDTAPDADARVDAIDALTARWQSAHEVHDVDVCVMSLHTHMLSAHIGVTRAVYAALATLLETAAPQLSTARHVQTIVKMGVPPALERMPDVPAARAWLEQVRHVVYADVVGAARTALLRTLVDAQALTKVQGLPFNVVEIEDAIDAAIDQAAAMTNGDGQ